MVSRQAEKEERDIIDRGQDLNGLARSHQMCLSGHQTRPVLIGPLPREFVKLSGPPDAQLASSAAGRALTPQWMHHTGRVQGTVRESGACPLAETTHRTHRERPVQCPLDSPVPVTVLDF